LVVCAGLVAGVADGKKKHKGRGGKVTVVSSQQQAIVDAGAITVRVKGGKGKRVAVNGLQANGSVRLTGAKKVKPGKKLNLPLTAAGKTAMNSCSVEGLQGRFVKGKKKKGKGKKSGGRPITPLTRNLAACASAPSRHCDPFDPSLCMQPFPNDYFTKADASTATGRRLDFHADEMPQNKSGVAIDPTDFNRADGFSPGSAISVKIPGLPSTPNVQTDPGFLNNDFPTITDPERFDDPDQRAVVIDAATGERQPILAELDANPDHYQPGDTADANLIIRPLVNFTEGHRYIVALRDIRNAADDPIAAPMAFRVYRDNMTTTDPVVEARRSHMENVLTTLQDDGIQRSSLYLAWDFTVASEHSLAGRALAIRNDALSQLGDSTPDNGQLDGSAPSFQITSVEDDPGDNAVRQVDGVLTNVPCYLNNGDCHPGGIFNFQANGDVKATPTGTADDPDRVDFPHTTGVDFRCLIPESAIDGTDVVPTTSGIFGHGLLGLFDQVSDMTKFANSEANIANTTWCATNWAGFSGDDIGNVINSLADLSNFNKLTDRMQQGFVNMIYLGRAMTMSGGFDTNAAFQFDPDGDLNFTPVLETGPGNLYWEGISQGAIMGGALTALEPDLTQSVLDVTGMNYSTLLSRSSDSGQYLDIPGFGLWANYPGLNRRPLILSLMQLLWDRGEANGYAQHMTDEPLPGTPAHHVLLQAAYGDHQVSNLAAEVEARTIGAQVHTPELDSGRHWATDPLFGLTAIGTYPFSGSAALVYYDGGPLGYDVPDEGTPDQTCTESSITYHGTASAPLVNLPPNPLSVYGCDPHSYPRRSLDGVTHESTWLSPSASIAQCVDPGPTPRPCYSNGFTGAP
jgi:hypothetical protein